MDKTSTHKESKNQQLPVVMTTSNTDSFEPK